MTVRRSFESCTCDEYFSVASLYGGGQSTRTVGTIFIVIPCRTLYNTPGETRSFTCDALSGVMKSPGLTPASPGKLKAASANNAIPPVTTALRNLSISNCIRTSVRALNHFPRWLDKNTRQHEFFTNLLLSKLIK